MRRTKSVAQFATVRPEAGQATLPVGVRLLCLLGIAVLLGWFVVAAHAQIRVRAPDFEYFYKGGAWLLNHGGLDPGYDLVDGRVVPRGKLDWYLPFVSRLMTLFALMPMRVAGNVWLVLNLVALVTTLRLLARYVAGVPLANWPVLQLLPLVLLGAYWLWEFRLNQINNLTLLLIVGSLVCWQLQKRGIAGFWLGLAVLLKLTPGLLVVWFALKRQYRTVAAAMLTIVLAGPVSDIVALRPELAVDSYRAWFHNAVTTGSQTGLIRAQRETDWRNQGLGATLSRWLHPTDYSTKFDNDPRVQASYGARDHEVRTLNVANLSLPTVARVATAVSLLTVIALAWLARRPANRLSPTALRLEWALFVLAMLWLMPVMRRYHMIWALPAVTLMCALVARVGPRKFWSWLAIGSLAAAGVAQFAMLSRYAEATGALLASVAVLTLPMVLMTVRLHGTPTADPIEPGGVAQ